MSIVIESVGTASFTGLSSSGVLAVTKPTGLAVGDVMIAHLSQIIGGSNNCANWTTPSGWTSIAATTESTNSNSSAGIQIFGKVADSSDVAASDFSFTVNGVACGGAGKIFRLSGADFVYTQSTGTNTSTGSISISGLTPGDANSLLMFMITNADAGVSSGSVAGYAIATDNPSWTEQYDYSAGDTVFPHRGIMAAATAIRPETSATGNATATLTTYEQNTCSVLLAIRRLVTAPTLATNAVDTIDLTTATGNAEVYTDGEATITARGVVWNTSTAPTLSNFKATVSGTTGVYTAPITGLQPNTTYYVRSYATNAIGTTYGNEVSFTTLGAEANQVIKDIDGVEGQTYAVSVNVGGTTGTLTLKLGTTGDSVVINAGAGVTVLQGIYGGLSGLIFEASVDFDGYIDDVMWVLVLGDATIDWDLDTLTNVYPINSSVYFKRLEDQEFDRFRIYRYLDVQFKDLNAYVTVLLKKEANEDLTTRSKEFLVSNVSGETLPFIDKRISMLLKGQALRIGFSNNNLNETFTVCQFVLKGTQEPRKLFDKSKIISV